MEFFRTGDNNFLISNIDITRKRGGREPISAAYLALQGGLGDLLKGVKQFSEERYAGAGYPTKAEFNEWLKTAAPHEVFGKRFGKPKTFEQFANRLGYVASEGALAGLAELTFPVSWGVIPPAKRELDVAARMLGVLITPTPLDYAVTKFVNKLGVYSRRLIFFLPCFS